MKIQVSLILSASVLHCAHAFTVPLPSNLRTTTTVSKEKYDATSTRFTKNPSIRYSTKRNLGTSNSKLNSSLNTNNNANSNVSETGQCDVLVLGSGPAARAIATLLSSTNRTTKSNNLDVLLADAAYDREWAPNYGVWEDEWQSIISMYKDSFGRDLCEGCIDRRWSVTDCYFGGSFDIPTTKRMRLDRPYYRIEKNVLQQSLSPPKDNNDGWYRVIKANHISEATSLNIFTPSGSLTHDDEGSTILLKDKNSSTISVRAKMIVDCTGHETKLVVKQKRDGTLPPGFQIAYGALVTVDETNTSDKTQIGPYDKEAMTLFDYRTDHFDSGDPAVLKKAEGAPTFMYAMPLENNRIFFEETSLVARPALSFQECKDRCFRRLEHLGIKVVDIEEEEFCYIPMGGPLPAKDQRVVAFGGAAAMVHPSTGYNLCRNMMGASAVAEAILDGLSSSSVNLDKVSCSAYHAMWAPSNIRQRDFAVFGGEFLMKQNVIGLRGFFDGFFRLSLESWAGFLAGWPGLPNNNKHETWNERLLFGLTFVSKLPLSVAADMLFSIVSYSVSNGLPLPQSVTPLLGEPESYEYVERPKNQGDVAAKNEARKMIQESKAEHSNEVPVAFDQTVEESVSSS
mmetsp:Transcript_3146/g.3659  ORF Transcript_3146/g.3659 Transcript_3146/m.3659 type:complete len:625 (+) Transcript_3146:162-2036(+)